jgi:hypothetical protein
MASVMGKQPQSLEMLLVKGVNVDYVDSKGDSVYHLAVTFCPLVITVSKSICILITKLYRLQFISSLLHSSVAGLITDSGEAQSSKFKV